MPRILSAAHRLQFRQWSPRGEKMFFSLSHLSLPRRTSEQSLAPGAAGVTACRCRLPSLPLPSLLRSRREREGAQEQKTRPGLREQHAWTTVLDLTETHLASLVGGFLLVLVRSPSLDRLDFKDFRSALYSLASIAILSNHVF